MKMNKISLSISTALLAAGFMTSSAVNAQGRLVVYCSATNILCETTTKAFGEKYDVKTSFIRNGSGSTFAKVEAENQRTLCLCDLHGDLRFWCEYRAFSKIRY